MGKYGLDVIDNKDGHEGGKNMNEESYKNVVVIGDIDDEWRLEYTGTNGMKQRMKLDAMTESDAKFEASNLLDVPEEEIEVEYA